MGARGGGSSLEDDVEKSPGQKEVCNLLSSGISSFNHRRRMHFSYSCTGTTVLSPPHHHLCGRSLSRYLVYSGAAVCLLSATEYESNSFATTEEQRQRQQQQGV